MEMTMRILGRLGRLVPCSPLILLAAAATAGFAQPGGTQEEQEEYSIPAQVLEGLNLASTIKANVAEAYTLRAVVPAGRLAAGMTADPADTSSKFVSSVQIILGEILITYGNDAHPGLAGRVLVLTPFRNDMGDVIWQCGYSKTVARTGAIALGGSTGNQFTTVDAEYLPSVCVDRATKG